MDSQNSLYDVIVIGGGASGMMAAGTAAAQGKRVLLLEKNTHVGKKLSITGGGRCNITNAEHDVHKFLSWYGNAQQFLYSAFSQFSSSETHNFFESQGLPIVVQARKRAFPHTERAADVVRAMEQYLQKNKVTIKTCSIVKKIIISENNITSVVVGKETYAAHSYILATGGVSHPETGSTGDGFRWLIDFGHTVKKPTPTIVPLATAETWSKLLSGTSLSFMKITFFENGKRAFSKTGKLLFTHFGLSGPLILNVAGKVAELFEGGSVVTAMIDSYPATDLGALEERLLKSLDANKNKMLKNVVSLFVPEGMAPGIIALLSSEINFDTKVHSVSRDDRKKIIRTLKALPVTVTHLMGFDRAVVADGGVVLEEIDTKTMRSKVVDNLFITGDLLNITRPSGGYSLQLCWTTGYVAGMHC